MTGDCNIWHDSLHHQDRCRLPRKDYGGVSTPAANHLFNICLHNEVKYLPEEQAWAFHHTTAQLLFLSHVRRNIQTTIVFLTTRVKQPDKDNWGKLKRVLKYLNSTRSLRLTLFADSLSNICWYVDASHQTHNNCKGHTGSFLTLARVQRQARPIKKNPIQKLYQEWDYWTIW